MTIGIWILGDRLSEQQSSLEQNQADKDKTPVILIESTNYVRQRPYHRQKLVLVWSAMRHFAQELREAGWQVTYEIAEDFETPLVNWLAQQQITELQITTPSDRPFRQLIQKLNLNCEINFTPDNHFLWSETEFLTWTKSRKRLLMEDFYRAGRKRFDILMADGKPVGGKWNYDKQNRKPPKKNLNPPEPLVFEIDEITQAVIERVKQADCTDYGELEPFNWAVTREQAEQVLGYFIEHSLSDFGTYQDAMLTGEYTLWHSLISPYLNLGMLDPRAVIQAVVDAYEARELPLNSVEGFIRQVMGWREYIRGIYLTQNEEYTESNWFEHHQPLPEFYWDATKTDMNCLQQTLTQVEATAYGHHIQRLMILNNFALIAGINPQELENWFHSAFIDAYDWVMQTNVLGMGQFADGGLLASKPYAASANYINKMSDYCGSCKYNKSDRTGDKACPFNFFYWDFLNRHYERLKSLGRMNLVLSHIKRISDSEMAAISAKADKWWAESKGKK